MLRHLKITNFAVVRELDVELDSGLIVITGETGAGKSIMVDAMGLVLGDRADSGVIRSGSERAEISATFDVQPDSFAQQWLEEQAYDPDTCILRRVLNADGRSRAFINGTPVTLAQLKTLGETLIDIHSQHEHQSLLIKANHAALFDRYAGATASAQKVSSLFNDWRASRQMLNAMREQNQNKEERFELLNYQLEEFAALDLQDGELEQLELEQKQLSNAESIIASGNQALGLIDAANQGSEEIDCVAQLVSAQRIVDDLGTGPHELNEANQLLSAALIEVREAATSLRTYLERVEVNPERLRSVESRLSDCFDLARKHRIQPSELIAHRRHIEEELDQLENASSDFDSLARQVEENQHLYFDAASQLTELRLSAIEQFNQEISAHLREMGMSGARLQADMTPLPAGDGLPSGVETIEFLVSTNPGQEPRPLNKIASGGELSRISLAIQVVTAADTSIPTLVFDEVDVGIGGATAETVGMLLRSLSNSGQVICVTHQAQVAAKAHHHFSVRKQSTGHETDSIIQALSAEEKVDEIARMLGGVKLTEQTIAHAREMLTNSE